MENRYALLMFFIVFGYSSVYGLVKVLPEDSLYKKICQQERFGDLINPPSLSGELAYYYEIKGKEAATLAIIGAPITRCYVYTEPELFKAIVDQMDIWTRKQITVQMAVVQEVVFKNIMSAILSDLDQFSGITNMTAALSFIEDTVIALLNRWISDGMTIERAIVQTTGVETQTIHNILKILRVNEPLNNLSIAREFFQDQVIPQMRYWQRKNITVKQAIAIFEKEMNVVNNVLTDFRDDIQINDMQKVLDYIKIKKEELDKYAKTKEQK